jgi:hypothetical protein
MMPCQRCGREHGPHPICNYGVHPFDFVTSPIFYMPAIVGAVLGIISAVLGL